MFNFSLNSLFAKILASLKEFVGLFAIYRWSQSAEKAKQAEKSLQAALKANRVKNRIKNDVKRLSKEKLVAKATRTRRSSSRKRV
jgi:hypothetical protein